MGNESKPLNADDAEKIFAEETLKPFNRRDRKERRENILPTKVTKKH